jgi:hypothetical protein
VKAAEVWISLRRFPEGLATLAAAELDDAAGPDLLVVFGARHSRE